VSLWLFLFLLPAASCYLPAGMRESAANWEFLCGRRFQLIQKFMEGFGGEVDHRGLGSKRYLVSIIQLIGLVCEYLTAV
jgi:hypothetical protein